MLFVLRLKAPTPASSNGWHFSSSTDFHLKDKHLIFSSVHMQALLLGFPSKRSREGADQYMTLSLHYDMSLPGGSAGKWGVHIKVFGICTRAWNFPGSLGLHDYEVLLRKHIVLGRLYYQAYQSSFGSLPKEKGIYAKMSCVCMCVCGTFLWNTKP